MSRNEPQFKQEIQQMMFIAGETSDPSTETVLLIESIVRDQVNLLLVTAQELAHRRGNTHFSNNDILFQIRHDEGRIERVRSFLTWKTIRRRAKDDDEKDVLEDAVLEDEVVAGSSDDGNTRPSGKIPSVTLPWDIESFFRAQVPEEATIDSIIGPASLEKLRKDDERTQGMSVAEYATWSEYRHASFTSRKMKRFREWSGLGKIADHRPNDDVLDILGFLTSEMVQNLTAEALDVQSAETKGVAAVGPKEALSVTSRTYTESGQLFAPPLGIKTPLQKSHVQLAFQRMQARKKRKSLFKGRGGKRPRLI